MNTLKILLLAFSIGISSFCLAQNHSVARKWNDVLLEAIRDDFARPTVHSRNLFHTSIALYDSWAVYDSIAKPYFLGNKIGGFECEFLGITPPLDIQRAREKTMNFAAYRLLTHRFQNSPGAAASLARFDSLFLSLGGIPNLTSYDYGLYGYEALGNYIAHKLIEFGLQDGSNEQNDYASLYYKPVNEPMVLDNLGNPTIADPNRWQPLAFNLFIDQSGNVISGSVPEFLGPEWGNVQPFALSRNDLTVHTKDGFEYKVYHDPGEPPKLMVDEGGGLSEEYKWGFSLVALWSSHLDPSDSVLMDISPASIGNLTQFPDNFEQYRDFYKEEEGGDPSQGYALNPVTGEPYQQQIVPRGDYSRVLAEFWADGPDSETPPGHWFTILNYVADHPLLEKRFKGEGFVLNDLEWDVKAYLILGAAMHDSAITAWGSKGYYDYIRPISAIRYMAEQGQSSDPDLPNYSPNGIPLKEGFIEIVEEDDPLAGVEKENTGKVKLYTWRGHDYINDPTTDVSGVGWILAERWWPYQRPSFVTPPFAGYVSGHSTFSRAAAEVLTYITGSEYFPGGLGEFVASKDEFLVFEKGPSQDITLQWATYRDASDQTSLSRIWGGIHPPADDIPGRIMGEKVAQSVFNLTEEIFDSRITNIQSNASRDTNFLVYPNPAQASDLLSINYKGLGEYEVFIYNLNGEIISRSQVSDAIGQISLADFKNGVYIVKAIGENINEVKKLIIK